MPVMLINAKRLITLMRRGGLEQKPALRNLPPTHLHAWLCD